MISRRHECKSAGPRQPHEAAVKVGGCRIEHSAVGSGLLVRVRVNATKRCYTASRGGAVELLVKIGHASHRGLIGEDAPVVRRGGESTCCLNVAMTRWDIAVCVFQLNEVGAIRHGAPVARIVRRVGVRARPLDVHAVLVVHHQLAGAEVIRHRREDLHGVAAPALDVEVVDGGTVALARAGLAPDAERMRAVLEGAAELRRVDAEFQRVPCGEVEVAEPNEVGGGVARHLGVLAVVEAVCLPPIEIARCDIVPDAHHACGLLRARCLQHVAGHFPLELCRVQLLGLFDVVRSGKVCELVLTGVRSNHADGRVGVPFAALHPLARLWIRLAGGVGVGPLHARSGAF
mmetsp:Transcript_10348/g.31803  ORF Transcript_10348/g.31803 Transcript_10348/m.31803 type:complete len:346 (-) Transcript_10348:678-1715(-)